MAGSLSPFKVGQTVELQDGRIAKVRFIGSTLFATGDWVGVELDDLSGKNDGAVQGERYFDCELGRGMFVRPAVAKVIEQPAPKVTKAPAIKGRPQSGVVPGLKRQSTQDATARRQTINAGSPTPMGKPPVPRGLRSPTKSPTKQMNVKAATPAGRPTTVPPRPRPSITRTPMAPPPAPSAGARTARQPVAGRPNGSAVRSAVNRLSLRPEPIKRVSSLSGTSQGSDTSGQEEKSRSPSSGTPDGPQRKSGSPLTWGVASRTVSSTLSQKSASTTATREVEDLKTKLRMMEKKRMEDREKLKALERIQGERDKFEMIIQKLQAKYHPQQQEITDLRKELKESQARLEDMETEQADHEIALEMATLDREMAEETAEVYKTELDALKQKSEELELEVEVLREENQELGQEMSTEERTSQGWLQMERTNERLREALLRLRDMTQQQEGELRDQIKSLEEDVQELGGVKEQYEVTKEKLQQSDAGIEDLRQQLDTALGAEEMIEELTDKNLALNEEMEELRATIEDLESLKELNDELEINHVETEKQMQEEIDYKNSLINDHSRRAAQQEEAMEDYEYTIARFRELVTNLQSDLEDMRASQQITETEAEELTNRSRAMMDLNMKLQLSASKTQVKTIDLELRRLEAQEASEHLAIVQLFLPEAFHTERDSVLALLRFKRVGFKSNLLHGFVKERVSGQALPGHEDDVFSGCDVLDKLTWVSAMCNRFVNYISTCSVDDFARFEGALYDLEPVERAMNGWIDGLRRDEMKEKQCAVELQRTMALMSHLAEIHLSDSLESFADDVLMRTLLMQSHLENTAAALSHAKIMVQSKVSSDEEISHHFAQKIESVVSHSRSAKVVVGKTIRSLEELKARSLSLTTDTILSFEHAENGTRELASYTIQLSEDLFALLNEEGRTEPFTFGDVQSVIAKTTESVFQTQEGDILAALSNKLRSLTNQLVDLGSLTSDLEMTAEFERGPAPWVIRSKELKSTKIVSIDTEEEIRRLKDDIHERATQLRLRDQTLEESAVKIELLESRMRDATKKGNQIHELERLLDEGRSREKDLADAIETQTQELQALESERDKWKRLADEKRATASGLADSSLQAKEGAEKAVATAREMEALKADILALQASVRYLRTDNRRLRTARDNVASGRALDFLDTPLLSRDRRSNSRGNDGAYVGHGAREESQRRLLEQEGHDVLAELLNLASNPKYAQKVDLGLLPKDNRTGWRPAKETPGYHVARQREYFESWKAWGEGVAKRAHAHSLASCRNNEAVAVVDTDGPRNGNGNDKGAEDRRRQKTKRRSRTAGVTLAPAARMDFYGRGSGARGLPLDDDGKENVQGTGLRARSPLGITVRRPDEWEALGSLVGFAQ